MSENPDLIPWQRSKTHPRAVFVLTYQATPIALEEGKAGCAICVFHERDSGCHTHRCAGGVWLDEVQAAMLRLES